MNQDIKKIIDRINKLNNSVVLRGGTSELVSYLASQEAKYCIVGSTNDHRRKNLEKKSNLRQLISTNPKPYIQYQAVVEATINGRSQYLISKAFKSESNARKWHRDLCKVLFSGDLGGSDSTPVEDKISQRVLEIIEKCLSEVNIDEIVKAYLDEEIPKALARSAPAMIKLHQNPNHVAEIKDMIAVGLTIEEVANHHGVSQLTIRNTLQ